MEQTVRFMGALVVALGLAGALRAQPLDDDGWREVRREVLGQLGSVSPVIQIRGLRTLAATLHPEAVELLLDALGKLGSPERGTAGSEVLLAAEEALGRVELPAGVARIAAAATEAREWWVRAACVRALGRIGVRDGDLALSLAAFDPSPVVRAATAEALGEARLHPTAPDILALLLEDPQWQVQAAAVAALAELRSRESVRPLIECLCGAQGRLVNDIGEVLTLLTGKDRYMDCEEWQSWWQAQGQAWVLAPESELGPSPDAGARAQDRQPGTLTFYGIPCRSKRLLFLIDVSGSMASPATASPEPEPVITGGDSSSTPLPLPELPPEPTRLDVARYELHRVILGLAPDARFGIVAFSDRATLFLHGGLTTATPAGKRRALKVVYKLQANGGTNAHGALGLGLDLAGRDQLRRGELELQGVDTIFFLTDGRPTVGATTDPARILQMVAESNRNLRVRINTVGVGTGTPGFGDVGPRGALQASDFLRRLADENDGTCVLRH